MNALGTHVLVELRDCNADALDDLQNVESTLIDTARRIGATIIGHAFHQFSPQGVTGVVIIAESHICIHTWPEHGYAAVDIFTCGDTSRLEEATQHIADAFGSQDRSVVTLQRGQMDASVSAVTRSEHDLAGVAGS
ncbi:MAG: adenosylmethionine decarboxylase [Dehalococcoidia bacterium]|nr:adenosylmethionine decarboxylase [Dehalococcoidia bacterium]